MDFRIVGWLRDILKGGLSCRRYVSIDEHQRMDLPGWTDLATLSAVSVTVSLALSKVDFWESGVKVSCASVQPSC
jgi:hypothetical protein